MNAVVFCGWGQLEAGRPPVSSDAAWAAAVPFVPTEATAAFASAGRRLAWPARSARRVTPHGAPGLVLVALHGGSVPGGLGIAPLAPAAMWVMARVHRMGGPMSTLFSAVSAVSAAVIAAAGSAAWPRAPAMTAAGRLAAARLSRVLSRAAVRGAIAAAGFGTGLLVLRLLGAG